MQTIGKIVSSNTTVPEQNTELFLKKTGHIFSLSHLQCALVL